MQFFSPRGFGCSAFPRPCKLESDVFFYFQVCFFVNGPFAECCLVSFVVWARSPSFMALAIDRLPEETFICKHCLWRFKYWFLSLSTIDRRQFRVQFPRDLHLRAMMNIEESPPNDRRILDEPNLHIREGGLYLVQLLRRIHIP